MPSLSVRFAAGYVVERAVVPGSAQALTEFRLAEQARDFRENIQVLLMGFLRHQQHKQQQRLARNYLEIVRSPQGNYNSKQQQATTASFTSTSSNHINATNRASTTNNYISKQLQHKQLHKATKASNSIKQLQHQVTTANNIKQLQQQAKTTASSNYQQ